MLNFLHLHCPCAINKSKGGTFRTTMSGCSMAAKSPPAVEMIKLDVVGSPCTMPALCRCPSAAPMAATASSWPASQLPKATQSLAPNLETNDKNRTCRKVGCVQKRPGRHTSKLLHENDGPSLVNKQRARRVDSSFPATYKTASFLEGTARTFVRANNEGSPKPGLSRQRTATSLLFVNLSSKVAWRYCFGNRSFTITGRPQNTPSYTRCKRGKC
jgi:hypothetical protein